MRMIRRFGACLLVASLGATAAPALADDDCDAPIDRWQSREAVSQMAGRRGWDLNRVKIDDGCYEVQGRDADGRSFKAKLDPETLEILRIRYRDRDRDREHRRDRDRQDDHERGGGQADAPGGPVGAPDAPATPAGSAPAKPFTAGTSPRGQIE